MSEKKECQGKFYEYGFYQTRDCNKYVAVGGVSCFEIGCDFNGSFEARSYDSVDEASDLLIRKAGLQALIRCELYNEWKENPDNYGKEPPSKLLPEFLRERTHE